MLHLGVATSQCLNTSAPFKLSVVSAVVSSALPLVTIPTNLLVCLAILIDPNKELRTQFNCFTFNLALADLLVGCVTEPISAYAHITEAMDTEHKHEVKPVVLMLFHIPYFVSAMASVLTIAALALERYLALTSPFRYRKHFSVKLTVVSSIAIWAIAFSFGLLNVVADYILVSFIFVNTAVLFTALVVCFACLKIRSSLRQVSKNWAEIGIIQSSGGRGDEYQMKLTKTFALIIGALLCCYIPACFMIYFMNLCQECDCTLVQWFRDSTFWLILLNSAANPFVYAIRSSSYRKAIKMIACCKCTGAAAKAQWDGRRRKDDVGRKVVRTQRYGSISANNTEQENSSGKEPAYFL